MIKTNTLVMMCGVPGCGKTTLINRITAFQPSYVVLSTDDYIEKKAQLDGKTYDGIFKDTIKEAEKTLSATLTYAIENEKPIIWDQTNISVKTRKKKLALIPDNYEKMAIWFEIPESSEWQRRLATRPGKTIPRNILQAMAFDFQIPTTDEGFDTVLTSRNFSAYMDAILADYENQ
jgi:predicted kinase